MKHMQINDLRRFPSVLRRTRSLAFQKELNVIELLLKHVNVNKIA